MLIYDTNLESDYGTPLYIKLVFILLIDLSRKNVIITKDLYQWFWFVAAPQSPKDWGISIPF